MREDGRDGQKRVTAGRHALPQTTHGMEKNHLSGRGSSQPMFASIEQTIFDEAAFASLLRLERKRTDRSGRAFLLLLLEFGLPSDCRQRQRQRCMTKMIRAVRSCIRQTDMMGWYKTHAVVGVIFTEVQQEALAKKAITEKIGTALQACLTPAQIDAMALSLYDYPQQDKEIGKGSDSDKLYPDLGQKKWPRRLKRLLDVLGGLSLLVLLCPILLLIGVAIKCTSKGPMLFRQERVGQFGQPFTFLKFRSMVDGADPDMHEQYVQAFIRLSSHGEHAAAVLKQGDLYKLSGDPRVTPLGSFLRRKSLDELPQLFNVLMGTMSLVGPRPPIPYEMKHYDAWHRRRVLEARPGMTGLWQVEGRSRTTFDDMVRLDLQYVDAWSLWTDIKILLQTPWAVIKCEGAR